MPIDSVHLYREYKLEFKHKQVSLLALAALISDFRGKDGFLHVPFLSYIFFENLLWSSCWCTSALLQTSKAIWRCDPHCRNSTYFLGAICGSGSSLRDLTVQRTASCTIERHCNALQLSPNNAACSLPSSMTLMHFPSSLWPKLQLCTQGPFHNYSSCWLAFPGRKSREIRSVGKPELEETTSTSGLASTKQQKEIWIKSCEESAYGQSCEMY